MNTRQKAPPRLRATSNTAPSSSRVAPARSADCGSEPVKAKMLRTVKATVATIVDGSAVGEIVTRPAKERTL